MIVRMLRGLEKLMDDPKVKADREKYEKIMMEWGIGGDEENRGQAINKEREGKHAEAVDLWNKMAQSAKEPQAKMEALSRIGYNRWKIAEAAATKVNNDWTKIEPQVKGAIDAFKAHLDFVRQNAGVVPDVKDVLASMSIGAYLMMKIAKEEKDFDAVLEFTKDLLEKYPPTKSEQVDPVIRVLASRIEANVNRRKPFEAETDFRELEKLYEKYKSGISQYKNSLTALALSFDTEAKRVKDSDKALYTKLFDKSLEYFKKALDIGGAKGDSFDRVLTMAELVFMTAEKENEDNPNEAKKKYTQARDLYTQILGQYAKEVQANSDKELAYKLRHRLVRCHLGVGDFDRANKVLDQMLQEAEDDIELLEVKGDVLVALAKTLKGNDQVDKYKSAADFYGKCAARFKRVMGEKADYKTAYYRNLYKWGLALFEFSDGQARLANFFSAAKARGEAPEWDGGEFKDKLNRLLEMVEKKTK
jgi:tetratricopeptide (TPR) repeat protein